jgi:hypothetical protein
MNPDVMITIAFVTYAIVVVGGIGVAVWSTHSVRDGGMDDGAAGPTAIRHQTERSTIPVKERGEADG